MRSLPLHILPVADNRNKRRSSSPEQLPDHSLRNTAIVAGAVLGAGAGLYAQQRSVLKTQRGILQRAANRDVASAIKKAHKSALADTTDALLGKKKATVTDPIRERLEAKIHQHRSFMDMPRPHQPEYKGKIDAIMDKVHAPIPEASSLLEQHGSIEGAKKINAIKSARVDEHVGRLKGEYQDRVAEKSAWSDFKKNVIQPHFKGRGQAYDESQPHPFDHHVYDKASKKIVDPDPKLTAKKKASIGLHRLVKLIELDFNPRERRDRQGQWSKNGGEVADPQSLQYAYHMPMVNPNGSNGSNGSNGDSPRGRGRPPGSLNKRTVAYQKTHQDSIEQQPEVRSHAIRNAAIGAGLLAGGALVAAPLIGKAVAAKGDERAAAKLLPKIASGKYLGFAERAGARGETVSDAIKNRFNNIKQAREGRLANAEKWRNAHAYKPESENPYTNAPYGPAPKKPKVEQVVKTDAAVAKADLGKAKAELEQERLARENDALRSKSKETHRASSDTVTENKTLKEKVKTQEASLKKAIVPPGETEQLKNAVNVIKHRAGGELDDNELKNLAKHHALHGRSVAMTRASGSTETPLFDKVSVTSASKLVGGGGAPVGAETLAEHVEYLKHRALNQRGGEIKEIVEKHGMTEDNVAHAMALHEAAASLSIEVPHIPKPTPKTSGANYSKDVRSWEKAVEERNRTALAPHREIIAKREKSEKEAGSRASSQYVDWMRKQGKKPDPAHRERLVANAQEQARRSHDRQMVSEGLLPDYFLKKTKPVGSSKSIASELLGFARRIKNRIELSRPAALTMEGLRPAMILKKIPVDRNSLRKTADGWMTVEEIERKRAAKQIVGKLAAG